MPLPEPRTLRPRCGRTKRSWDPRRVRLESPGSPLRFTHGFAFFRRIPRGTAGAARPQTFPYAPFILPSCPRTRRGGREGWAIRGSCLSPRGLLDPSPTWSGQIKTPLRDLSRHPGVIHESTRETGFFGVLAPSRGGGRRAGPGFLPPDCVLSSVPPWTWRKEGLSRPAWASSPCFSSLRARDRGTEVGSTP